MAIIKVQEGPGVGVETQENHPMQRRETGEVSGSDVNHNDREESKGCGKKQAFRYHARQGDSHAFS